MLEDNSSNNLPQVEVTTGKKAGKTNAERCAERRKALIAAGMCALCGKDKHAEGRRICQKCYDRDNTPEKLAKSAEKTRGFYLKWKEKGVCRGCGGKHGERITKTLCAVCAERYRKVGKQRARKQRQRVLDYYGRYCACCGESEEEFLAIDHINNDGKEHRDSINVALYQWLIQHKFPSGFQTLCYNCNMGKFRNGGTCPHKRHPSPEYVI